MVIPKRRDGKEQCYRQEQEKRKEKIFFSEEFGPVHLN
jgi:hypothetical protein